MLVIYPSEYLRPLTNSSLAASGGKSFSLRFYRILSRTYGLLTILLALLLYALGGWPFVVWGICVRLVLTYHCTFLVNSGGHTFGYKTFPTNDLSTNCWWVALLSYGEGWHNNHHAYQGSPNFRAKRYEFDPAWYVIRLLAMIGAITFIGKTIPQEEGSRA